MQFSLTLKVFQAYYIIYPVLWTTDAQWRFFSLKCQTFELRQTICADKFWGIRGMYFCQHPFGYCESFFTNQTLFLQKLSHYILISNIYLALGFEFGPQRIRDLKCVQKQSRLTKCRFTTISSQISTIYITKLKFRWSFWGAEWVCILIGSKVMTQSAIFSFFVLV